MGYGQEIGSRIRVEREAAGMTIDQLADALGVSARWLRLLEAGSVALDLATALRLREAFGPGAR